MTPTPWRDFAALAYTALGGAVYGPDLPDADLLRQLRDALANVKLAIQALESAGPSGTR